MDACGCCSSEFVAFEKKYSCQKCANTICKKCVREVDPAQVSPEDQEQEPLPEGPVLVCKDCEFMGKWVNDVKKKDKGKFWNIKMPTRFFGRRRAGSSNGSDKMPRSLNQKFSMVSTMLERTRLPGGSQRKIPMVVPSEIKQDLQNLSREKLKEIHEQKKIISALQEENARMRNGNQDPVQLQEMKDLIDELKRESEAHIIELQQKINTLVSENTALRDGENPPPSNIGGGNAASIVQEDPKFAKYRKMQKCGLPEGAIMHAARKDGVELPETFFTEPAPALSPPPAVKVQEDPKFAKYRKMQKCGLPEGAIMHAANKDGIVLPADFFTGPTPSVAAVAPPPTPVQEDPKFAKYRKMQKCGLPEGAIIHAAKKDGIDLSPNFFSTNGDSGPDSSGASGPPAPPPLPGMTLAKPAPAPEKPKSKYELTKRQPVRQNRRNKQLRGIFWNVIPADRVERSMWPSIPDQPPFEVTQHLAMLEDAFVKVAAKKIGPPTASMKLKSSERPPFLDAKRLQNLGIAIARFKEPVTELREHILRLDQDFFTMEVVHKLISMVPTAEEIAACKAAEQDWAGAGRFVESLSRVEHFVYEMAKIPRLRQRLQCVFVEMSFERQSESLMESIQIYEAGCTALKNCQEWKKLLHLVLVAGNYINSDSKSSANAWGFEVSTGLQKLAQAKASNNKKYSLLHWIADVCDSKFSAVYEVLAKNPVLVEAASMNFDELKADLAQLSKGCELVEKELKASSGETLGEPSNAPGARQFCNIMRPFLLEHGRPATEQMKKSVQKLEMQGKALLELHGESPIKCTASQLMNTAVEFLKALNKAQDENAAQREQIAKQAELAKKQSSKNVKEKENERKKGGSFKKKDKKAKSGSKTDNEFQKQLAKLHSKNKQTTSA